MSELESWFDDLWEQIVPFEPQLIRDFIDSLPLIEESKVTMRLPNNVGVWSRRSGTQPTSIAAEASDLIERLRMAPSREWANCWLDLARQLIEVTELGPDDPRISMSMPQNRLMAVTIIRRYVLWVPLPNANSLHAPEVGLILPASNRPQVKRMPDVVSYDSFRPGHKGETQNTAPLGVIFATEDGFDLNSAVLDGWKEAAIAECSHGRRSNFRKHHQPIMYRAVSDDEFRLQLFDEAFPD